MDGVVRTHSWFLYMHTYFYDNRPYTSNSALVQGTLQLRLYLCKIRQYEATSACSSYLPSPSKSILTLLCCKQCIVYILKHEVYVNYNKHNKNIIA